jgi:hypothetical protein
MSMSLKSELITVLLWGDRWWLPQHKLPVPFADLGQAADMLAAAWPAKSRKLRLVYHPDDFVSVAVACPNGGRAALALALADRHPELAHPGHAWGFEPVRQTPEGFCTVLHYEARPRLFALSQRLEERGFQVESAWPLATWLSTLAPEPISGGAVLVAALHADRFASYHRGPDGAPGAHHLAVGSLAAVAGYTDDALLASLEEQLPAAANRQDGVFHLWEALAKPFPLSLQHPAQLLPLVPRFAPRRIASAISLMLAGLTLWTGAMWAKDHAEWRRNRAAQQQEEAGLRDQIAVAEKVQSQITTLEAEIKLLAPAMPDYAGFLEELGRKRSDGVVFSEIKLEGNGVSVAGWLRPGQSLDRTALPSTVAWLAPTGEPGGRFVVTGSRKLP